MPVKESTGSPDVTLTSAARVMSAVEHRFDWPAYAVLAAISAVGAGFAAWAYPIWDDGLWDMFYRLGSDGPADYVGTDRPFFCWLVKYFYSAPRWFWFKTVGLSVLTTWGLGLFTLYVAKRVLPAGQALPTACLATAPLLIRAQIALITYPLLLASIVGGFAATYLFATGACSRSPNEKLWRWSAGAAILVVAGLLTEYTVAVAAAGMVWIVFMTWPDGAARRRGGLVAAVALGVLTLAVYAVYHHFSDTEVRPDAAPEVSLAQNLRRLHVILPILATSVYRGCLGERCAAWGPWAFKATSKEVVWRPRCWLPDSWRTASETRSRWRPTKVGPGEVPSSAWCWRWPPG